MLIEDNLGDIRLIIEAIKEGKSNNNLNIVYNGADAIDFLYQKGKYSEVPRPDLVILDLNIPKKDGREVLAEIKTEKSLKSLPVVILTSSETESDINRAYNLHANCYITKPSDLRQFIEVVNSIIDFWLIIVKLPPGE